MSLAKNENPMAVPIQMDSRKFLKAVNESAQSKVAIFERHVSEMGKHANKNWKLVSLRGTNLFFEDTDRHEYYQADHHTDNGRITITNIAPIQIIEGEKESLFQESCTRLVNAIESNSQKDMQASFERMKAQRFSSRVIPASGYVVGRDGVTRHVAVTNESLTERSKDELISVIVENLRNKVIVENGNVVAGYFNNDEEFTLPVNKWAARKLVARRMREAAKDAYWSEGFQNRIYATSKMIAEDKIEEAVSNLTEFLDDKEEFTLLTRSQVQTLVENALAAKAIFNQALCDDTASLFYKTNLKISKSKILEEWKRIAMKSEHSTLVENVDILSRSKDFATAYDQFLKMVFEAISNREVSAEALATTLSALRDKTPKIKESHDLSSRLNGLIARLRRPNFDDAAIYEAEDFIATIQEELAATETLSDFDQIPTASSGDDTGLSGMAGGTRTSDVPVININAPLIQIGGQSSGSAGGTDEAATPEIPADGLEDESLDDIFGGAGGAPPAPTPAPAPGQPGQAPPPAPGAGAPQLGMESFDRSFLDKIKGKKDKDDDDSDEDSDDPYAFDKKKDDMSESIWITNYGTPVITDPADLERIARVMQRLVSEHKLSGPSLIEQLNDVARASIHAVGIRLPPQQVGFAVHQAIEMYNQLQESEDCEPCDEDEEEEVVEDQYKIPQIRRRGFRKTSYKKNSAANESISWSNRQEDAVLGEFCGVKFIFDHGGDGSQVQPVILSEDGAIEIPIPSDIHESAFAAAGLGRGDKTVFVNWLSESLEQLRPITDEEDRAIEEAIAKISIGDDGQLSVEVTSDVEVGSVEDSEEGMLGDEQGEESGEELLDNEPSGEEMKSVDSIVPPSPEPKSIVDTEGPEEMPDFEKSPIENAGGEEEEEEEEEDGITEDKDITDPDSSKYTKHAKDDKRAQPTVKVPNEDAGNELDGIGPKVKKDDGTGTKSPVARG